MNAHKELVLNTAGHRVFSFIRDSSRLFHKVAPDCEAFVLCVKDWIRTVLLPAYRVIAACQELDWFWGVRMRDRRFTIASSLEAHKFPDVINTSPEHLAAAIEAYCIRPGQHIGQYSVVAIKLAVSRFFPALKGVNPNGLLDPDAYRRWEEANPLETRSYTSIWGLGYPD